jgi:aminopeptidase N
MKSFTRILSILSLVFIFLNACVPQKNIPDSKNQVSVNQVDSIRRDTLRAGEKPEIYRASRTRFFDLLHMKLEISLDWKNQWVNGVATLTLRPYFYPQRQLILDARNFDVQAVKLLKNSGETDLKYFNDRKQLFINLDSLYTRDQEIKVKIDYTAKPSEIEAKEGKVIESDRGFYFINPDDKDPFKARQAWTQGESESNSCWFPTIDAPNERTTGEIFITVEDKFVTLSNGVLVYSHQNQEGTRTDYWKTDLPIAPYLFMIAAGDFRIVKDQWKDVPLYYYVEPAFSQYAKDIFGRTPEMLTFFSDKLGFRYPWPKYSQIIVRDFVTGAMENATATVFNEDLLKNDHELVDENDDNTIAHELFHHWFGDMVTCESWSNLPLNESFADYSEYLWNEHKYGSFEADLHAKDSRDQYFDEAATKQVNLIRFNYDDPEDMFDSHSYSKGGLILHMLRKYVGDEAFFKALNIYLERNKFSSVEIHNLRLVFEEVTGEDLNWFFNEWFLASGHPEIKVETSYSEGKEKLTVQQTQVLGKTPLYRLPLYIDIWSNGEKHRFYVTIDKIKQTFEFDIPAKPDLVIFDGEQQLLAKVSQDKDVSQYIYQYYHSGLFKPKFESIDTLSRMVQDSTARKVLIDALSDPFWYFRQLSVNAFENYTGIDSQVVMTRVNEMINLDPNSIVRADAINTLFSIAGNKFLNTYRTALQDTSYAVTGSALYACIKSAPDEVPGLIKRFESFNDLYIVIPLASYFIDSSDQTRYDWFVEKIHHLNQGGLWYMLQYFGEFLMKSPETDQRKGIVILEQYARNHQSMYARWAAYQGIYLLSDLKGVKEILEDIRKNEKNVSLQRIYQTMN